MVCAAAVAQLQMPGNKVGMEVGQKDVADVEAKSLRVRHVLFDITLRIDDDRRRAGLVPQQIRGMGQATQIVLFENHVFSSSFARDAEDRVFTPRA